MVVVWGNDGVVRELGTIWEGDDERCGKSCFGLRIHIGSIS